MERKCNANRAGMHMHHVGNYFGVFRVGQRGTDHSRCAMVQAGHGIEQSA